MRQIRIGQEVMKDKALTLAIFAQVHRIGQRELGDRLKIHKLLFLISYELFRKRLKALTLAFFTYRWGPFTDDLYEIEADFEEAGLLQRDSRVFRLTEHGMAIGSTIYDEVKECEDNSMIVNVIDHTLSQFAHWDTAKLTRYTHEMQVKPIGWHEKEILGDLPLQIELTRVLDDEESLEIVEVDSSSLDSLGAIFNRSSIRVTTDSSW